MRKAEDDWILAKNLSRLLMATYFYLPRSGKVMQRCRSKIKIRKKGLMDFETLKPLFLVLFGIILSSFDPV